MNEKNVMFLKKVNFKRKYFLFKAYVINQFSFDNALSLTLLTSKTPNLPLNKTKIT